jgi:SAM-dependent methyltransferase
MTDTTAGDYACGVEGCGLDTRRELTEFGWTFYGCERCGSYRCPDGEVIHHFVKPDPVGDLSLVMRVLFHMRLVWLTALFPRLKDKSVRILDVGCGDGQFLQFLQERGYTNAAGIEPETQRAQNARLRGVRVYDSLEAMTAATGLKQFDVMFLWHVLEHLRQPATLLRAYARELAPGGVFLMSVPNHYSAQTRLFGRFSAFPDYGRHLWFHHPKLTEWTREALPGIRVDHVSDWNYEYEIYGWVDTLGSSIMRDTNFIHRAIKKGEGAMGTKLYAAALAAALLPIASIAALIALTAGRGSTLTIAMHRPGREASTDTEH